MSDDLQKTGSAKPKESETRRPWWKRPLTWLGGVLTVMIAGIATAYGTGLGQDLVSVTIGVHPTPLPTMRYPIHVDSASYLNNKYPTFAFPGILTKAQVSTLVNDSQLQNADTVSWQGPMSQVAKYGGAPIGDARIQIVLRNKATQTAVITNMQVVKHCDAPLTGTLLYAPGGGALNDIEIGYDLDVPLPVAQFSRGGDIEGLHGNFFAKDTIPMKPGETDTLVVDTLTDHFYCQFSFALFVDDGSRRLVEKINNSGHPFVVTATTYPMGEGLPPPYVKFSEFGAIYAWGLADPFGHNSFRRVNPRRYNGGVG